jgi:hypothetical protein
LQLLGTLEDRGLVDHLSDQEKRDFRDGKNLASDKFREVIEKGENEFVTRSQFDYLTADASGKGKGKSGSGRSGSDDDDNILLRHLQSKSKDSLKTNRRNTLTRWH